MGYHPKVVFILSFLVIHSTLYSQSDTLRDKHGDRYIEHTEEITYKWPFINGHVPSFIGISGSLESFKYPVYSIGLAYSPWDLSVYPKGNSAFAGFEGRYKTDKNTSISGWDVSCLISSTIGFGFTYGQFYYLENRTRYTGIRFSIGSSYLNISIMHRFFNWEKNKIPDLHHTVLAINMVIPVLRLSPKQKTDTYRDYIDEY